VGAGEIQLNINGQKEVRLQTEGRIMCPGQDIQLKKFEKEPEKLSTPSNKALIEFVENLRIQEEIKVHNQRNAKRRIQHKKFLELERKEIKTSKPTRKMWQKKVSTPTTSASGDDNQTKGKESPAQDSKPELSP
jgi:ABC-type uncharacterized transport system ATPase component